MDRSSTKEPAKGSSVRRKNWSKKQRMRRRLSDQNGLRNTNQKHIVSTPNLSDQPHKQETDDNPTKVQIAVSDIEFSASEVDKMHHSSSDLLIKEEISLKTVGNVSTGNSSAQFSDCRDGFEERVCEMNVKPVPQESQCTDLTSVFDPSVQKMAEKNAKFEDGEKSLEPSVNVVIHGSLDIVKELSFSEILCSSPDRAPVSRSRRKLLILDLNGLLADIVSPPPKDCKSDINISRRAIFTRPFCYDFLKFCFERFNVGIWSSRSKKIVDRVVDYLLGDLKNNLLFCWDLSYCTESGFKTLEIRHKTLVFKELRKIWDAQDPNLQWRKGDYNESNTLLLDDSPYKALLNPMHTAIFPHSYTYKKDRNNNSLGPEGDLRIYLENLAVADNVQNFVKHHPFGQNAINETSPSWEFYKYVITNRSSKPS